ncbi:MAG: D-aminoacyl-tRNA deacylase [Actinomycetota bacterium]|nr:D-aminoacyl-tRNA deacylase [Actinomycetota bacterium]
MRVVLQRVSRASVSVEGSMVAEIGPGLLLLVASGMDDAPEEPQRFARKIAGLRVFADDDGKMNRSVVDVGGAALVVSQFTLYGDVRRGRRPSWQAAAEPDIARKRIEDLLKALEAQGVTVASGRFGAQMDVELVNDGPVTLILDGAEL